MVFTAVFALIYVGDRIAALAAGHTLWLGLAMGLVVAFPFAAINILPQSVLSDIIQQDSLEHGVNREGFFSAAKTFLEKIASALAMVARASASASAMILPVTFSSPVMVIPVPSDYQLTGRLSQGS